MSSRPYGSYMFRGRRATAIVLVVSSALIGGVGVATAQEGPERPTSAPHLSELTGAPLDLDRLAPGDRRQSRLELLNDGDGGGALVVDAKLSGALALLARLEVTLERDGKRLYSGPLKGLDLIDAGPIAPGQRASIDLSVSFPDGPNVNGLQGLSFAASFSITVVQA